MIGGVRRIAGQFVRGLGAWKGNPVFPTVFHLTHYKAGSQWVNRIFHALAHGHLVEAVPDKSQFFRRPITAQRIYPTVYATRQEFDGIVGTVPHRRFVVARDLRDTLVSAYFSFSKSHPRVHEAIDVRRAALSQMNVEDGLLYLINSWLPLIAEFQWSWLAGGDELVKYEDLLVRDEEILSRILLKQCRLPVAREKVLEVIRANRFETFSGRKRGTEDTSSHERKGIAGDWRNHFTDKVAAAVKARHGSLLIATGYESGFNW